MKVKKLAKGAVALGVGTALLLGGAGTFAYWNQTVEAGAGKITAGNLELTAQGPGEWTDGAGNVININTYKVVPGDRLTYMQDLDVKLEGNKIVAKLSVGQPTSTFTKSTTGAIIITDAQGVILPDTLTSSKSGVIASVTFDFPSTVTGTDDVGKTLDFSGIQFKLEQVHQEGLQTPTPTSSS